MILGQPVLTRYQPRMTGYDFYAIDLSTLRYPEKELSLKELPDGNIFLSLCDSSIPFDLNSRLELLNQEKKIINLVQFWQLLREASLKVGPPDRSPKMLLLLFCSQERITSHICSDFTAPLYLRQDGRLEELLPQTAQNGTMIASSQTVRLEAGETLIFCTPSLTALRYNAQEDFGLMYWKSLILQNKHRTEEIGLTIAQAAWLHRGRISTPSSVLMILKILAWIRIMTFLKEAKQ